MTDPRIERALEEYIEAQRLSRRRFLGRAGSAGLALTGLSTVLAACGGVKGTQEEAADTNKQQAETVSHPKTAIGNWTFSNWPLYMDKKILKAFDKKYGGHVRYLEDINDNYEFFGKVRQQLENKQAIGRDLVVLTDYMVSRWIRNGYAEPIDKRTSRTRPTSSTTSRTSTTTRTASTRCRTSPGRSASATTSRRPAAS
jgi:spermidine/putrescine transport system substrate-binding protein